MVEIENTGQHGPGGPEPKWDAIVSDRLVPLPRRKMKVRDLMAQAGIEGGLLVRDYTSPIDVALQPDATIDLVEGNVFRVVDSCDLTVTSPPPGSQAKFAFVVDDDWELTIQPIQSLESLRGLFDLPDDAELFRDLESPNDQPIRSGEKVSIADGPVFTVRVSGITVKVNRKPVSFTIRRVDGLDVKKTAIAQGVEIKLDFVLHRKKPDGDFGPAIGDHEILHLRKCDEFRCVAPDDNS